MRKIFLLIILACAFASLASAQYSMSTPANNAPSDKPDFSITASITTLRDATDVLAVRTELMARVKKEFLQNVASGLEGVERRLKESI